MRWLVVGSLLSISAWGYDECVAGAKRISLDNGASTADYTGNVVCYDADTKEETRSMAFLHGKLTGREKRKWSSGESMEQEYRDGKRNGEYRKYSDGKLLEVSHYVDDRELGEALRYSKTGKVIRKVNRREPESASTWQDFDEEGRLSGAGCGQQSTREAGLAECVWQGPSPLVFFHPNGQKRAVIELRDGLRNGLTTLFTREGAKAGEQHYVKGLRDGLVLELEEGKPRHSIQYAAGERAGEETEYFSDGARKKVTVWKGREESKFTEYFQNGSKKFERVHDGQKTLESQFDDEGRLEEREQLERRMRQGPHERFLPDGGLTLREIFVEGALQGRRQAWFADGRPEEDSQWAKGNVTTRKRWDSDGGLVEDEAFYEDGSRKKK